VKHETVYVNNPFRDRPTFHRMHDGEGSRAVCGIHLSTALGNILIRRDHAEKFADACSRCFRES